MSSRGVGVGGEHKMSIPTHLCSYSVTSHAKAMEDAVEIGLRAAFNEVGFSSFSKVLPGLKLKGEHLWISCGIKQVSHPTTPSRKTGFIVLLHR